MNKLAENFYRDVNNRYIEKLSSLESALGSALSAAGASTLSHFIFEPKDERDLMSAALTGALCGGIMGAGNGGSFSSSFNKMLLPATLGTMIAEMGGALVRNMRDAQ